MRLFFFLVLALNCFLFGNYKDCDSPKQVLEYETQLIEKYSNCNSGELCNALISREETYILLDEFELAIQDFLIDYKENLERELN